MSNFAWMEQLQRQVDSLNKIAERMTITPPIPQPHFDFSAIETMQRVAQQATDRANELMANMVKLPDVSIPAFNLDLMKLPEVPFMESVNRAMEDTVRRLEAVTSFQPAQQFLTPLPSPSMPGQASRTRELENRIAELERENAELRKAK